MVRVARARCARPEVEPEPCVRAIDSRLRVLEVLARARAVLGAVITLALPALPRALPGQSAPSETLAAELFTGFAWNLRTPLVIEHDGQRRVVRSRWSTRPFEDAPYYSYRVARASVGGE